MTNFLKGWWNSNLRQLLIALPATAIGIVVNNLTGPSGEVKLPAQSSTNLLLILLGIVWTVGGVGYSYYSKLEALKKEHEVEKRMSEKILFVRGRITGGKWVGLCPKCQMPAQNTCKRYQEPTVSCSAECGWSVFTELLVEDIAKKLENESA